MADREKKEEKTKKQKFKYLKNEKSFLLMKRVNEKSPFIVFEGLSLGEK